MTIQESLHQWVMSCDNPTHAEYEADRLWKQGLRSADRDVLTTAYGYTEHDTDILCAILKRREDVPRVRMKEYNPELGF